MDLVLTRERERVKNTENSADVICTSPLAGVLHRTKAKVRGTMSNIALPNQFTRTHRAENWWPRIKCQVYGRNSTVQFMSSFAFQG